MLATNHNLKVAKGKSQQRTKQFKTQDALEKKQNI